MQDLTDRKEWQRLATHHRDIASSHMREWFDTDHTRSSCFSIQAGEILLDYSRNRITQETLQNLIGLATAIDLKKHIEALFTGQPVNTSENRPALHTALRDPSASLALNHGQDIPGMIAAARKQQAAFVQRIHSGEWKGVTGKPIQHIVNLGIGGSHLGPLTCIQALKDFAITHLQCHFISCVDSTHFNEVLQQIDPETSLFIVSSKSFTTLETLTNAQAMMASMKQTFGEQAIQHHFVAVTAAPDKAQAFGLPKENIFPLWEWVGGRYSIWSAVGLSVMLMIGVKHFDAFLQGAYEMDQHFRHADFSHNMPVIMALLGIWYTNFFGANAHVIAPYSQRLRHLIAYLQQAEMESNGKHVHHTPIKEDYMTGSVIFGEAGCNAQHTYHQLLHQGKHVIPVDFILIGQSQNKQDDILLASALSQAQALMRGKTYDEAYHAFLAAQCSTDEAARLARHSVIPGNRPSNILLLNRITPHNLGALIALYEHKIFVQGVIWGVNSFDQWGVELGKQLLPHILKNLDSQQASSMMDANMSHIINHIKSTRNEI
jgi:glucose-6-phosphate isomerase